MLMIVFGMFLDVCEIGFVRFHMVFGTVFGRVLMGFSTVYGMVFYVSCLALSPFGFPRTAPLPFGLSFEVGGSHQHPPPKVSTTKSRSLAFVLFGPFEKPRKAHKPG